MPVPTSSESNVDVLVIGAGPSGLMAANALKKAGVNVRIVDLRYAFSGRSVWRDVHRCAYSRPAKVAAGHADGIQPRTIEVLQVCLPSASDESTR